MSDETPTPLPGLEPESYETPEQVDLPIHILGRADVEPYIFNGHEVVALVMQAIDVGTGAIHPWLVFIAPQDAGPLGRRLISVASPLKPVTDKESK